MQISLNSPSRKLLFAAGGLLLVTPYLFLAIQTYRAHYLSEHGNLSSAMRLSPSNADYRRQSGEIRLYTDVDLQQALSDLRLSTELNPFSARSWLSMATAYQVSGNSAQQSEAIEHAVTVDPTTPDVAWEAAAFYGARGEVDKALQYFRVVSQYDEPSVPLEAAWRLTHDADKMLQACVPDSVSAHTAFLRLMIANNEEEAAQKTWEHMLRLRQDVDPKLALPYIRYLLEKQAGDRARVVWGQLAEAHPALTKYAAPPNLIVNAGFEEELLNGGLDWLFTPRAGITLAIDTSTFRSGAHSLVINYDGAANSDAGAVQYVPVEPNSHYEVTVYTRAEQLTTANGPYVSATDARSSLELARSEEFIGSYPWKPASFEFQTGDSTQIVTLSVKRQPAGTRIRGKLWLDDLGLLKK